MALTLEERVDPSHGMLMVVDMQNDFCHPDGAAYKRGRDMGFVQNMILRLIRVVEKAREHSFPICFVRSSGNQWTNSPVWTEFKNAELLACTEGSWGAEFHAVWNRGPTKWSLPNIDIARSSVRISTCCCALAASRVY